MGRPRINITDEVEKKARNLLLSLIPRDGEPVGNSTLSHEFLDRSKKELKENFGVEVYWQIRNGLIDAGQLERGRGKGGSVRLVTAGVSRHGHRSGRRQKRKREALLYESFRQTIQTDWVRDYDTSDDYVAEVYAQKGSKDTKGKWTRPDVVLVSVGSYPYIPGKSIEVISFEIKPEDVYGVEGIYETASHSAFANKSYLALHLPEGRKDTELPERLETEAARFGVGLLTFGDPAQWSTFDVLVEPTHKTPSPGYMNDFLKYLKDENRNKLLGFLK